MVAWESCGKDVEGSVWLSRGTRCKSGVYIKVIVVSLVYRLIGVQRATEQLVWTPRHDLFFTRYGYGRERKIPQGRFYYIFLE